MYKIKQIPEDFIVKEIPDFELEEGPHTIFFMKKKNLTTLQAIHKIAKKLHIKKKRLGFAGSKDKKALTTQYCSAFSIKKERLQNLNLKGIDIKIMGESKKPLTLGDLKGNQFKITVRNLTEITSIKKEIILPNYFDEQRFSKNNVTVGKALIKENFQKATQFLSQDYHEIIEHLQENPNDYIGSLRKVPKKILLILVHSYQSYLFNLTLNQYIKNHYKDYKKVKYSQGNFLFPNIKQFQDIDFPIFGFGTKIKNKEIKRIYQQILKKENITKKDFIIKPFPELSSAGQTRQAFLKTKIKTLEKGSDKLNKNKKKIKVGFQLPPGSYATLVIKYLFN